MNLFRHYCLKCFQPLHVEVDIFAHHGQTFDIRENTIHDADGILAATFRDLPVHDLALIAAKTCEVVYHCPDCQLDFKSELPDVTIETDLNIIE